MLFWLWQSQFVFSLILGRDKVFVCLPIDTRLFVIYIQHCIWCRLLYTLNGPHFLVSIVYDRYCISSLRGWWIFIFIYVSKHWKLFFFLKLALGFHTFFFFLNYLDPPANYIPRLLIVKCKILIINVLKNYYIYLLIVAKILANGWATSSIWHIIYRKLTTTM